MNRKWGGAIDTQSLASVIYFHVLAPTVSTTPLSTVINWGSSIQTLSLWRTSHSNPYLFPYHTRMLSGLMLCRQPHGCELMSPIMTRINCLDLVLTKLQLIQSFCPSFLMVSEPWIYRCPMCSSALLKHLFSTSWPVVSFHADHHLLHK